MKFIKKLFSLLFSSPQTIPQKRANQAVAMMLADQEWEVQAKSAPKSDK